MNRELLLSLSEAVLSSLDAGESPRKIVDALVKHYDATCSWNGCWALTLLRVRVEGEAVNCTLLRSWAVRAAELAALPVVGFDDMAAAKAVIRKRRSRTVGQFEKRSDRFDHVGQDHPGLRPSAFIAGVALACRYGQRLFRNILSGGRNV